MKTNMYKNPCKLPLVDLESKYNLTSIPGGISIPPGWNLIVDEALEKLTKLPNWEYTKIFQIKEKFGTLRIYLEELAPVGSGDVIREAEEKAMITCHDCGLEVHKGRCINLL